LRELADDVPLTSDEARRLYSQSVSPERAGQRAVGCRWTPRPQRM